MKSLLQLSSSLFKDLKRLHPEVLGLDRDLLTIKARLEDEGSGFVSVALPSLGKAFDQSLSNGRWTHIPGFSRNGPLPKFLRGLVSLVFDAKTGRLLENASVESILSIRQVCYLFKKFLPDSERNEKLSLLAFQDFRDVEEHVCGVAPYRLDRLSKLGSFMLQDLDMFQDLDCRHGPGAVEEGYRSNQKWLALYRGLLDFDHRLLYVGYDLQSSLVADQTPAYCDILDDQTATCARLVTVPKSCSALRTITVEPLLNQFVQQGLNSWIRDCISRCPTLSQSLALTRQDKNQELALEGSRTGDWCTIDLSSASDLLSFETVKAAFSSRPRFLNGLNISRTPSVKIGSDTITLKKFAGMGNATTFPVQSVVFAMIAYLAIIGDKRITFRLLSQVSRCVRVYGDDIVVRREHFQEVAKWLISFGLKINRSKTFSVGNFRESCGVDAFRGTDVTPVYLRHEPSSCMEPSAVASLVSTSNHLWLRGYYEAAKYLERTVERAQHGPLPLVSRDSDGLGWHTRQDVRTCQRWSRTLHRWECRTYVLSPTRTRDVLSGMPALIKYFHQPLVGRDDPTHLSDSVRRFQVKLRRRWVRS